MRVLIFSQYLPPLKNISAIRITEVSNQFVRNGFDVIGFSTNNYQYELTDKYDLDPRVQIVRSDSWDILVIRAQLKKWLARNGNKKNTGNEPIITHDGLLEKSWFAKQRSAVFGFLANYLPFSLLFGPGNIIYILVTFFKALKYVQHDTVIFSSFRPYSDHLVAFLIKLFYPRVTWICDFRDPHIPPNAKGLFFKLHAWVNAMIFRHASIVTTVSHGIKKNLESYNSHVKVLRNGIVGSIDSTPVAASDMEHFNIIYTGMLYEGTRDPSVLLQAVSELFRDNLVDPSRFRLVYAGKDKAIWDDFIKRYGLAHVNESHGQLPMAEAKRLQDKASINLLLTWADRNYKGVLTGKMYEYFKARRPIVTIINGDKDPEIEEIMQVTNAGPVVYGTNDHAQLKSFILTHYHAFLEGRHIIQINDKELVAFQWDHYFPDLLKSVGLAKTKAPGNLRKIAIVSYYFPPCNMTPANRVYSWAKYMNSFGYYPVIITRNWDHPIKTEDDVDVPAGGGVKHEVMDGYEVYYLPYTGNFRTRLHQQLKKTPLRFITRALTFLELVLQNTFPQITPFGNFFRFTQNFVSRNRDLHYLVISANPYTLFSIGYSVKKKFGLKWLADYRDDWSTHGFLNSRGIFRMLKGINAYYERKWMRNADLIVSISDHYVYKIGRFHGREAHVIENGYFDETFKAHRNEPQADRLTIAYSGSLYDEQPVEVFIKGYIDFIRESNTRPNLVFMGLRFNAVQSHRIQTLLKGFEDYYTLTDRMPYNEAIKLQQSAWVMLMMPYGNVKGVPGSKMYDYIGSGKPVIICPSDNDLIEATLTSTGQALVCNDAAAVTSALHDMVKGRKIHVNHELIGYYTRRNQCKLLCELIDNDSMHAYSSIDVHQNITEPQR